MPVHRQENRQLHEKQKLPPCVRTGAASLSKSLFDKLSNANRGAGFAFEEAAPGCAHNLCAACAQIPHLPGVLCFVRGSRPRTKPIHILFRRARRNSTRFFDSLSLFTAACPAHWRCRRALSWKAPLLCRQRTRSRAAPLRPAPPAPCRFAAASRRRCRRKYRLRRSCQRP